MFGSPVAVAAGIGLVLLAILSIVFLIWTFSGSDEDTLLERLAAPGNCGGCVNRDKRIGQLQTLVGALEKRLHDEGKATAFYRDAYHQLLHSERRHA